MANKRSFTQSLVRRTPVSGSRQREINPIILAVQMCSLLIENEGLSPPDAWMTVRPRLVTLRPKKDDVYALFPGTFNTLRSKRNQSLHDYVIFVTFCTMVFCAIEEAPAISGEQKPLMQNILVLCREARTLVYSPHPFSENVVISMRRLMAGAYSNAVSKLKEGDFGSVLFADAQAWMVLIARQAAPEWDSEVNRPPGSSLTSIERHCIAVIEACVERRNLVGTCPGIGEFYQIAQMFLHSLVTGEYLCLRRDWEHFRG